MLAVHFICPLYSLGTSQINRIFTAPAFAKATAGKARNPATMSDIQQLTQAILQFRDERDWEQYHNGKDLALCLSIEASELLELFLWKQPEDVPEDRLKDELADVIYSAFLLAAQYKFDIKQIVLDKLEKNKQKYPVEKAKGSNRKYDEL
jgi:NTP pyrophosphatase (non-canonical NTP hydrolase)